jgi:phosphopantetheinyl transferase (holo-ACP synthase)
MIVGVGIDVVDIARFERSLARTPGRVPGGPPGPGWV